MENNFHSFQFSLVDFVRPEIWTHADVGFWYQENLIVYCSKEALRSNQHLKPVPDNGHPEQYPSEFVRDKKQNSNISKVHPQIYFRTVLKLLPSFAWNAGVC